MSIFAALRPDDENLSPAGYVAAVARNAWFYRPVITTYQAQLNATADAYGNGFSTGMDRAKAAVAPAPRQLHASRTTSTGVTLHALGGAA